MISTLGIELQSTYHLVHNIKDVIFRYHILFDEKFVLFKGRGELELVIEFDDFRM